MRDLKKNKQASPTIVRARNQRKSKNPLEAKLWTLLRNRRLGGLKFRRQQPVGPYVLDFYCPQFKLAIELDGSGHTKASKAVGDVARDEIIRGLGIRLIRFWNSDLIKSENAVLERILEIAVETQDDISEKI